MPTARILLSEDAQLGLLGTDRLPDTMVDLLRQFEDRCDLWTAEVHAHDSVDVTGDLYGEPSRSKTFWVIWSITPPESSSLKPNSQLIVDAVKTVPPLVKVPKFAAS